MKIEIDLTKEELIKLKNIVLLKYIKLENDDPYLYKDSEELEKEIAQVKIIYEELENKIKDYV